jgi:hypothetical protein
MVSGWKSTWVAPLAVMIIVVSITVAVMLSILLYVRCGPGIPSSSAFYIILTAIAPDDVHICTSQLFHFYQ